MRRSISASSQSNTPAILTSAGTAITANERRAWSIQNLGTNPLFVRLGSGASTSLFHFVLKGGTGNDDGTAGSVGQSQGLVYQGIITVAGTSPRFTTYEA